MKILDLRGLKGNDDMKDMKARDESRTLNDTMNHAKKIFERVLLAGR